MDTGAIERAAEQSDADLMAAIGARRDRAAFAQLFGQFAPRIKAYMRRLGADDGRAEDLVQDVMLTVWRRASLYDRAQASVSTWLFTIARNKRIDALRKERHPEIEADDPMLVLDPSPPADAMMSAAQAESRLRAALEILPRAQVEVLRKNFFEDKSHGAIAAELDLPLGTVKSRARLALIKLRQTLKDVE